MKYELYIVVILAGLLLLFPSVFAADNVNVVIHIPAEEEQTHFGNSVLVAGIWHYMNITISNGEYSQINIKLYKGSIAPTIEKRNETNYYEWSYDENSSTPWTDVMKYDGVNYIKETYCVKADNIYSFYVGIMDMFPSIIDYYENWMLEVDRNGEKIYSKNVVIEKPMAAIAKHRADTIQFFVDPFTEMNADGNDYFILDNIGNVPLNISIDYGAYNNILTFKNFISRISPNASQSYYLSLHAASQKPGILRITGGTGSGSIPLPYIVLTNTMIAFDTSLGINIPPLEELIGHSNHEIIDVGGGMTFQYEQTLKMYEGEKRDVTAYLSGNGQATLDISSDQQNITILKILSNNNEVKSPFTITSTDASEQKIVTRIEALKENKDGFIEYKLQIGGTTKTYKTLIDVGPPSSSQIGDGSQPSMTPTTTIIVVLCIALVIGYMIFSRMRHRRR